MQTRIARCLVLVFASVLYSWPAQAGWTFQAVNPAGAVFTEVFGLNNQGSVVGVGATSDSDIAFVYNSRTRQFTTIAPAAGFLGTAPFGIVENGRIVGSLTTDTNGDEAGFIREKDGTYTVFSHPGSPFTEPRGINNQGMVTGLAETADGNVTGFLYDSKNGSFTDFVPSCFTVAQGIDSQGVVVGSAIFNPAFCPSPDGSLVGTFAWLRSRAGNVTFFRVNGRPTTARGISESGLIAGSITLPNGIAKGFVTTIAAASSGSVSIPDADLLAFPGHQQTTPEGITDNGVVSGITLDFDPVTGMPTFGGFVATMTR